MSIQMGNANNNVFRFKFSQDINLILQRFASIHHGDDLEEFKEAWERTIETYRTIVDIETMRLNEIGFDGDVENKMFISARYYYSKQYKIGEKKFAGAAAAGAADAGAAGAADAGAAGADASSETETKRQYTKIDGDTHKTIEEFLTKNYNYSMKPAIAWNNFCNEYGVDLCPKKTFKNRIYNYREKIRKQTSLDDVVNCKQEEKIEDDGFGIGFNFDDV